MFADFRWSRPPQIPRSGTSIPRKSPASCGGRTPRVGDGPPSPHPRQVRDSKARYGRTQVNDYCSLAPSPAMTFCKYFSTIRRQTHDGSEGHRDDDCAWRWEPCRRARDSRRSHRCGGMGMQCPRRPSSRTRRCIGLWRNIGASVRSWGGSAPGAQAGEIGRSRLRRVPPTLRRRAESWPIYTRSRPTRVPLRDRAQLARLSGGRPPTALANPRPQVQRGAVLP